MLTVYHISAPPARFSKHDAVPCFFELCSGMGHPVPRFRMLQALPLLPIIHLNSVCLSTDKCTFYMYGIWKSHLLPQMHSVFGYSYLTSTIEAHNCILKY